MLTMEDKYVLVTGATGLVGAHVVDNLLLKGRRVRAVVRSKAKAEAMRAARPSFNRRLDFFYINDLTTPNAFDGAVESVDGVIHIASPLNYTVADKENELIIPAIEGVKSILKASLGTGVRRVVITSSFGAVLDMGREADCPYTYSSRDWNPITYAEATDPTSTPQDAYRGSKVFAEKEAWRFLKENNPDFDLVTLCPSMVFGPVAGSITSPDDLNESNALLWRVATGGPSAELPPARFNFWIDVRDLAEIHVQALLTPSAGGKRYVPVSPEKFNYQIASDIMCELFPEWARESVCKGKQVLRHCISIDNSEMERDFPNLQYTSFQKTVFDLIQQLKSQQSQSKK